MKKIITYITAIILLFCVFSATVNALDEEAEEHIYEKLLSSTEDIDLTYYSLSTDDLSDIFDDLMNTRPDLFFVSATYSYTYTEDDVILSMQPKYKYSGNTLKTAEKTYDSFIDKMVSGVKSSWSDAEKLLYIHDYLVLNCSYDIVSGNADVYMLAKTGSGTCVSYTLAMIAACDRLGIECDVAKSDSMNHIWNVVKVDGKWYHIDVTWDDTVPDMKGQVLHNNFLRSDEGIRTASVEPHANWICDYECASEKYDPSFISTNNSPFVYLSGSWYSVDSMEFALCKYDFSNGTKTKLSEIPEKWPVNGASKVYVLPYSGVGVYGNCVYYNSPTGIYKYDPTSGASTSAASPKTSGSSIYYFTVDGDAITYYLAKEPNSVNTETGTFDLDTGKLLYPLTYIADGTVYAVQYYSAGDKISPPDDPTVSGLIFLNWDTLPETMPESPLTVTAVYDSEPCDHEDTDVRTIQKATCTEDGKAEVYCVDCGAVISTGKIKAAHKEGAWYIVSPATCMDEGERRRDCTECGKNLEKEILPKSEIHTCGDWVVVTEATDTEDGLRERTCTLCGNVEDEVIPKTGSDEETAETAPVATEAPDTLPTETTADTTADTSADTVKNEPETTEDSSASSMDIDTKLVIIYIVAVTLTGLVNGFLIYLIVIHDKKRRRKK